MVNRNEHEWAQIQVFWFASICRYGVVLNPERQKCKLPSLKPLSTSTAFDFIAAGSLRRSEAFAAIFTPYDTVQLTDEAFL